MLGDLFAPSLVLLNVYSTIEKDMRYYHVIHHQKETY